MPDVVGGLRARLTHDSMVEMIEAALEELGWLDPTIYDDPVGTRRHHPVRVTRQPVNWSEPIEPNLIAVTTQDSEIFDAEVGSDLSRLEVPYVVDVYAESESLGLDLSGDIIDIMRGRYPVIGRVRPTFAIYDFRSATPSQLGYGVISQVERSRTPMRVERAWLQNWFSITSIVTDHYTTD